MGSFSTVIMVTVIAAARDTINAVLTLWLVKLLSVLRPSWPCSTAPTITNRAVSIMADEYFIMREVTAVPKTLAESFAPSAQPRKKLLISRSITPPF